MRPNLLGNLLPRAAFGFMIAVVFAVPALFDEPWRQESASMTLIVLNVPGIFCGFLFDGRFFPPEGWIGQSIPRWILMVLVQGFVWLFILSCVHFLVARFKRSSPWKKLRVER